MAWRELINEDQLQNEILAQPDFRNIVFKHSSRCGISSMALKTFERSAFFTSSNDQFWLLDVLKSRSLSMSLANQMEIRHESPQVLVFLEGKVIHHASHADINADLIHKMS